MNSASERLKGSTARIAVAVLERGRTYTGIVRPKGFRHQRTAGACFWNAASAALDERGRYVEGFACRIAAGLPASYPIHHAWLTVDGEHAIDQTWRNPDQCAYFGLEFPIKALALASLRRGWWGMLSEADVLVIAGAAHAHFK